MNELQELSTFVAETNFNDIPAEVITRAKWVLRDSVGVIIGGMSEPEVNALADHAARNAPGAATLFAHGGQTQPGWAVLVHGTAGTTLEMDEGHAFARGHAAIHSIPPALAMGEALGVSGKEILATLVLGYEVAARAGVATKLRKGVHPFGAWGVLGAAAVGARFGGLDATGVAGVLEVAASYAITPSFQTAYQGANVRNTYAGIVNRLGLLAAELYSLGFRGERGGLETAFGYILGDSFDLAALTDGLGERYEIMRGYFKPYSGCRYTHAAIDAVLALEMEAPIEPGRIAAVEVATYDIAATLTEQEPQTPLAGRFSMPHVVAVTLLTGSAGPEAFTPAVLRDPQVRALAKRVTVVEDPAYSALTPAQRPARVTLIFTDGTQRQSAVNGSKGDPDQPMTSAELETKFHDLVAAKLGPDQTVAVWQELGRLDELPSLNTLWQKLGNPDG